MAIAATVAAVPVAFAAGGHHHPARVQYLARGVAVSAVSVGPPEALALSDTQFKPSSIGKDGSSFSADLGSKTRFVNHRGRGIAVASIKAGDRVVIVWTEPSGTAFSDTLVATKVVDNGPPPPVHYYANGRAAGAVVTPSATPWTLALLKTTFKPASLDSNGPAFTADLGVATKFVGRHGHALAPGSIKTGDRISVTWTEPAGTAFVPTLVATRLVDLSRR
jgi:hypothetical protein